MPVLSYINRLLLMESGGYCANPDCHTELYKHNEKFSIEELAHIIAQSAKGPRGDDSNRHTDDPDNIILLCPSCHTIVDKGPEIYTEATLLEWKKAHKELIENTFKSKSYTSRNELKKDIDKLLNENKSIYDTYGPHTDHEHEMFSDKFNMWERLSILKIIPNNAKIVTMIENNYDLLNEFEKGIFQNFKLHHEGFKHNKISGDKNISVPMFPSQISQILEDA